MKIVKLLLLIIFFITAPFMFAGKEKNQISDQELARFIIAGTLAPNGVDQNEWAQYVNVHPACVSCLQQFEDPTHMKEHIKKCCAELLSHN